MSGPRKIQVLAMVAAVAALPPPAQAETPEQGDEAAYQPSYQRRSDFHAGVSYSLAAMSARGYPNEAGKLNNPAYVSDPGVGLGSVFSLWLGAAFRDWFSFGVGAAGLSYSAKDLDVGGGGFITRVEVFPLFYAFEQGRDLGLYGSFGIGGVMVKAGDETKADGGALSIVGFGAFYEPLRFGNFSAGPTVEYTRLFSQSLEMQSASAGMRLAFYGGP